eukprot:3016500-Pleurochrysis_carterae.AAC.1
MARSLQPRPSKRMRTWLLFKRGELRRLALQLRQLCVGLRRCPLARSRAPLLEVVERVDVALLQPLHTSLVRQLLLAAPCLAMRAQVGAIGRRLLVEVSRRHGDERLAQLRRQRVEEPPSRACPPC